MAGLLLVRQLRSQRLLAKNLLLTSSTETVPSEGHSQLDLSFPFVSQIREISDKLCALESLYSETAVLLGVSPAEYPLRVSRVESGSLWVRVFGESRVVTLLIKLIDSTLAFFYRSYTNEGQITRLNKSSDAVRLMLKLSAELKSEGIDVEEFEDEIKKASVQLGKELNRLLAGEPAVIVNGISYSLDTATAGKAVGSRDHLKLIAPVSEP